MPHSLSSLPIPTGRRRNGFSVRRLLMGLAGFASVAGLVWYTFPSTSFSSNDSGPLMQVVTRGDFIHDITELGTVESASNIDIRCEVESRGSQGTMILELIDEGTYVKPGDVLCKLDSSSLDQQLVEQQIVCNTSEAAVIQARNNHETAEISKDEYLNGTYQENRQKLEGNVFVAKENLRVAEETLVNTESLFARGFVTELAVEADKFSREDAVKKDEKADTELMVLEKYTKAKMLSQLDADIKTTEARLKSVENSHALDMEKLADIITQIEKCTIVAPEYGQVVYANVTDHYGGSNIIIEEGESVRERQLIFRLPDPDRMQVKAKVNEASVCAVTVGMTATIRLDAFPKMELDGEVVKVSEYPLPTSFMSGSVKEYETTIRVHLPNRAGEADGSGDAFEPIAARDSSETESREEIQLRPGMTAEVKIRVETIRNVLLLPIQTIIEHGHKKYCLTYDKSKGWAKQEVKVGSTNDKAIVIRECLREGDKVVMDAARHRDKVSWPKIEANPKAANAGQVAGTASDPRPVGKSDGARVGAPVGGTGMIRDNRRPPSVEDRS